MYYMSTRTVRLDEESEQLLEAVRRAKGLSVSDALKRGLLALREAMEAEGPSATPYDVYRSIELGQGGSARGSARRAKAEVARAIRAKARR